MKEQIKWNATNGKEITVTVELTLSETVWADGDEVEVKCCKINIKAEVEGMGTIATSAPYKRDNIKSPLGDAVAVMGKLALNQEKYDLIMGAIAKLEATPEWQAKMEAKKQAAKIDAEYEAHSAKMRKMMSE
jgi:hypothetical protein